jgi:hypothetical protein
MTRWAGRAARFLGTHQGCSALGSTGAIGEAAASLLYPRPLTNVSDNGSPALERHRG